MSVVLRSKFRLPPLGRVDDVTVRVPNSPLYTQTVGGSGDACVIRCFDGTNAYFAKRRSDETAVFAGLRRVENVLVISDPANAAWIKAKLGSATAPVVDSGWYPGPDGQLTARRITFDVSGTTSNDFSRIYHVFSGAKWGVASVWMRLVSGGPKIHIAPNNFGQSSRLVTLSSEWRRYSSYEFGTITTATNHGIQVLADGNIGNAYPMVIEIATAHPFAPQCEVDIPNGSAPGENIPPNSFRYFHYTNPNTVGSDGIVTDTGVRTPISGGGLIVPGARTEYLLNNDFSVDGAGGSDVFSSWAEFTSGSSTIAKELDDLPPAPFRAAVKLTADALNSGVSVRLTVPTLTVSTGDKLRIAFWHKVSASGKTAYLYLSVSDGVNNWFTNGVASNPSNIVWQQGGGSIVLDTATTAWTFFYFELPSVPAGVSNSSVYLGFSCNSLASASAWATGFNVGLDVNPNVLIRTTTAAVARNADTASAKWRQGSVLAVTFVLDTRDGVRSGVLLTPVDSGGAEVGKVEITSGGNIKVTNGASSWTSTNTVPSGQAATRVALLAGPAGIRASIGGNTETASSPTFNWSSATDVKVGHDAAGTTHIGMPMTVLEGYRP